jgi:(2R)-ethylmalonyl-CoA mutase
MLRRATNALDFRDKSSRDKPLCAGFARQGIPTAAAASNELYRKNLSKGQTGLSVAFDLPTQTGYDSDHPLAKGEVGKVGVPISHIGDMRALFDGIPLGEMNTSMTINATAAWLLALYIAVADEQGVPRAKTAPAPPRTTSSRNTSRAAPMCSRRRRRCG